MAIYQCGMAESGLLITSGFLALFPLQIRQPRIGRNLEAHFRIDDDIDYAFEYSGIQNLKVNRYPTVSSCRRHRSPPSER